MTSRLLNQTMHHSGAAFRRDGLTFPLGYRRGNATGNIKIKINDIIYAKRRPLSVGAKALKIIFG